MTVWYFFWGDSLSLILLLISVRSIDFTLGWGITDGQRKRGVRCKVFWMSCTRESCKPQLGWACFEWALHWLQAKLTKTVRVLKTHVYEHSVFWLITYVKNGDISEYCICNCVVSIATMQSIGWKEAICSSWNDTSMIYQSDDLKAFNRFP